MLVLELIYKELNIYLERTLKVLENFQDNDESLKVYNEAKIEMDSMYDHIAEGIQIRSVNSTSMGKNLLSFF